MAHTLGMVPGKWDNNALAREQENAARLSTEPVETPDSVYYREVAEKFGYDAYIRVKCAVNPEMRDTADLHVDTAYRYARIAWHFALRITE